jgi:pSer/pThr/pTyr-binding forkhead associated (FHA) protein
VSRFHTKIQEDSGLVILTDLESTNGTRVNGHPVQMRVLRKSDQLSIGRCLLVYSGRDDRIDGNESGEGQATKGRNDIFDPDGSLGVDDLATRGPADVDGLMGELFPQGPPLIPQDLGLAQQAQLSDLLAFVHDRIRFVLESAKEELDKEGKGTHRMLVERIDWDRLLKLEMDLAIYLRKSADPNAE